jgi:hypothetical protein
MSLSKPTTNKKWKHTKPYAYTNNKSLKHYESRLILDTYLHKKLQPHTSFKTRAKKLKFYSIKNFKRYNYFKLNPSLLTNIISKNKNFQTVKTSKLNWKFRKFNFKKSNLKVKKKKSKIFLRSKTRLKVWITRLKISRSKTKSSISLNIKNINTKIKNATYRRRRKHTKLKLILRSTKLYNTKPTQTQSLLNCFSKKKPLLSKKLFKKKKNIQIKTKSNQAFILKSPIMFFKQFFLKNSFKTLLKKFIFKKTIFSFYKPNEIRRNLMNFKKKFFTYNLIFNDKIFRRQGTTFRPSKIKQFYKNTYYYNFINQ